MLAAFTRSITVCIARRANSELQSSVSTSILRSFQPSFCSATTNARFLSPVSPSHFSVKFMLVRPANNRMHGTRLRG